MKKSNKLLACPFCESNNVHITDAWPHYAYCLGCNAGLKPINPRMGKDGTIQAAAAWNRRVRPEITKETTDGYHTFNELYHHRAVLFSVICNDRPNLAWKSKLHHDGTMFDDHTFIVGIDTPSGKASYHYDIDPYWDMFHVPVLERAPEWDGYTPVQSIERIGSLAGSF